MLDKYMFIGITSGIRALVQIWNQGPTHLLRINPEILRINPEISQKMLEINWKQPRKP